MPAQQGAAAAGQPMGTGVLDTKVLGKPKDFSGEEKHYADWKFTFENYAALLHQGSGPAMELTLPLNPKL